MASKIVTKPWGKEEWIELNDKYCFKQIFIKAGMRTSLQYHLVKLETIYVMRGRAELWLEDAAGVIQKRALLEGDCVTVLPQLKHRVVAVTDLILQEVSTPEVDDVVRVEDDTHRGHGRIEGEHQST